MQLNSFETSGTSPSLLGITDANRETERQKYQKKYRATHTVEIAAYRAAHKVEIAANVKAYQESHKAEIAVLGWKRGPGWLKRGLG
jgi:hypothetical protein